MLYHTWFALDNTVIDYLSSERWGYREYGLFTRGHRGCFTLESAFLREKKFNERKDSSHLVGIVITSGYVVDAPRCARHQSVLFHALCI